MISNQGEMDFAVRETVPKFSRFFRAEPRGTSRSSDNAHVSRKLFFLIGQIGVMKHRFDIPNPASRMPTRSFDWILSCRSCTALPVPSSLQPSSRAVHQVIINTVPYVLIQFSMLMGSHVQVRHISLQVEAGHRRGGT